MSDADDVVQRLLRACELGELSAVEAALSLLGDPNVADAGGRTGLMIAASRNRLNVMRRLLDAGADPNRANVNGITALMYSKTAAFTYGDCDGMRLLIDAGADRDATDARGLTALDYTQQRSALVIDFLTTYRTPE